MTECYFGSNGFYPFVAGESKQAEREIFALLADIWGPLPAVCSIKVKRQTMKCILTRIQLKGDCRRAERCGIACQPRVMARRTERSSAKNVHISKLNFLREKRRFDLPQTPTRATSDGRAADWRIVCSTGIAKRFGFASRERDHSEATIAKE